MVDTEVYSRTPKVSRHKRTPRHGGDISGAGQPKGCHTEDEGDPGHPGSPRQGSTKLGVTSTEPNKTPAPPTHAGTRDTTANPKEVPKGQLGPRLQALVAKGDNLPSHRRVVSTAVLH